MSGFVRVSLVSLILLGGFELGIMPSAWAGLRGAPAIQRLTRAADFVLVVREVDLTSHHAGPPLWVASVRLEVLRTVKGSSRLPSPAHALWSLPVPLSETVGGVRGRLGLAFVKKSATGDFELIPLSGPSEFLDDVLLPLPEGELASAYAYGDADADLDKVLCEIYAAVERRIPAGVRLSFLHFGEMDRLQSSVTKRFYERAMASSSADLRVLGLAGLVRQGDVAALLRIEKEMDSLLTTRDSYLIALGISGFYRNTDPAGLAALSRLTKLAENKGGVQVASAQALAAIHNKDSLPYLADLLASTDPEVRSCGVGGLAMFANNVAVLTPENVAKWGRQPLPGEAPYRTPATIEHSAMGTETVGKDEAKYLDFWKAWWRSMRFEVMR